MSAPHPKTYIAPITPAKIEWLNETTPLSVQYDDVYFSRNGGTNETRHIFLKGNVLEARFKELTGTFTICETGFGTGLNFLSTIDLFLKNAPDKTNLHFISVEKQPLQLYDLQKIYQKLPQELESIKNRLLDIYPPLVPGTHVRYFSDRIKLTLLFGDAAAMLATIHTKVDAWFLDGFSPAKNPDVWSDALFFHVGRLSQPTTTAATYSVAKAVHERLTQNGFAAKKQIGFGYKSEMTTATYTTVKEKPITKKNPSHVTIIGGGLAGTATAYHLARHNIPSTIFEKGPSLASGASGNDCGLIYPRLTADITKEGLFYLEAYIYALHHYQKLGVGDFCGVLRQAYNDEDKKRYAKIIDTWQFPESFCKLINNDLYYPGGGILNPRDICHHHVEAYPDLITVKLNTEITTLDPNVTTIITAGIDSNKLAPLKLEPSRGQVTYAAPQTLKHAITYDGYSASTDKFLCIGSTYQRGETDTTLRPADDTDNIARFQKYLPHMQPPKMIKSWAGVRAATPERFPMFDKINETVFVNTGHGSYGLTSTPLCAEKIVQKILDN